MLDDRQCEHPRNPQKSRYRGGDEIDRHVNAGMAADKVQGKQQQGADRQFYDPLSDETEKF